MKDKTKLLRYQVEDLVDESGLTEVAAAMIVVGAALIEKLDDLVNDD